LSFGLTHLKTVERRKIKSGSSAADAGVTAQSRTVSEAKMSEAKTRLLTRL
jgi:hypothetical protein